jgi:hypothetical protein
MKIGSNVLRLISLDVLFRALIGVGFAAMIVAGLGMPRTTFGSPGLYPTFVGSIGLVVWIALHLQEAVRAVEKNTHRGRIYDLAYEFADIPARMVHRRTIQTFAMLGALIVGVWLLSFQLAVPLFLLFSLRFQGKASWYVTVAWIVALELLIVVVFGTIAHVAWPRSILEAALGVSFQNILGGPIRRLLPL